MSNLNQSVLKSSLPHTMAGIAAKAGLKLAFGQPRTDGQTVWVSDIPLNPTEEDFYMTVADLDHEIGHILFTDFNFGAQGLTHALTNCFEDVRIEYLMEQEFLGARDFLHRAREIQVKRGLTRKPDTPANALAMFLITNYYIQFLGRDSLQKDSDNALKVLQQSLAQDVIDKIVALCDSRMPFVVSEQSTTADALKLAEDVVALLQSESEDEQPEEGGSDESSESGDNEDSDSSDSQEDSESGSGNSQSDEQSEEQSNEQSGAGSDDGESDDSEENDGSGSNGSGSSDSNESDSDAEGSGEGQSQQSDSQQESDSGDSASSGESQGSESSDSQSNGCSKGSKELLESDVRAEQIPLREIVEKIAKEAAIEDNSVKQLLGHGTKDIASELRNINGSGSASNYYDGKISPNLPRYNSYKAKASKDIAVLRNKLLKIWTSRSRTRNIVNDHDGRFDVNEAVRCVASGESNYLVKRTKRTDKKPAVSIVGDLSTSMNGSKFDMQTESMIALAETCSLGNVPLNIIGFSDKCVSLKKWHEPMPKARGVLGGQKTISGTQIIPAVYEGLKALSSRKEEKKILIVMTDGSIGYDEDGLKNLVDYAEKTNPNIEIYGLGMGVNLSSVFKKGGRIHSENISQTMIDILSK